MKKCGYVEYGKTEQPSSPSHVLVWEIILSSADQLPEHVHASEVSKQIIGKMVAMFGPLTIHHARPNRAGERNLYFVAPIDKDVTVIHDGCGWGPGAVDDGEPGRTASLDYVLNKIMQYTRNMEGGDIVRPAHGGPILGPVSAGDLARSVFIGRVQI